MARTWQEHGKNVARTWQEHGISVARASCIKWSRHPWAKKKEIVDTEVRTVGAEKVGVRRRLLKYLARALLEGRMSVEASDRS